MGRDNNAEQAVPRVLGRAIAEIIDFDQMVKSSAATSNPGHSLIYAASMEDIDWPLDKDQQLRAKFGFGFERVVAALAAGALLDDRDHPNEQQYGHQRQLVVQIDGYAWVAPYVEDGKVMFLKTMFPSRKATKEYLGRLP